MSQENDNKSDDFDFDVDFDFDTDNQGTNANAPFSLDKSKPLEDDSVDSIDSTDVAAPFSLDKFDPFGSESLDSVDSSDSADAGSAFGDDLFPDMPPADPSGTPSEDETDEEVVAIDKKGKKKTKEKATKDKKGKTIKKEKGPKPPTETGEKKPVGLGGVLSLGLTCVMLLHLIAFNVYCILYPALGVGVSSTILFLGIADLLGLCAVAVPFMFYTHRDDLNFFKVALGVSLIAMSFGVILLLTEWYRYDFTIKVSIL